MSETFSFRFGRAEWVALSTVVARRPLLFRLAVIAATLAAAVMVMSVVPSSDPAVPNLLADAARGGAHWYPVYLFVVLAGLAIVFRHRLVGFNASLAFNRMPLADKEMVVELAEADVHVASGDFDWRFPWAAVARVIETADHLVISTGGREGLPIPRAAFADAPAYERVRAFVLAHLVEGATHERL